MMIIIGMITTIALIIIKSKHDNFDHNMIITILTVIIIIMIITITEMVAVTTAKAITITTTTK